MHPILFTSTRCPHSLKTSMFLTERGVAFHRVEVDMKSKAHQRAPYTTQVNPNATVPAMFDREVKLGTALDIMLYVDRRAGDRPLFPEDAPQRQAVLTWIDKADRDFWDVSHHLYWQVIEPPADGPDAAEVARLNAKGHALLAKLDAVLDGRAFVMGDAITAADIALLPWVYGYKRFDLFAGETAYPNVRRWRDALIRRESFTSNYKVAGEPLEDFLARRVVTR